MNFTIQIWNYAASSLRLPWKKLQNIEDEEQWNDYRPTFYLLHPVLQSLFNAVQRRFNFQFEREKLFFEDGGHIALDWSKKIQPNLSPPVLIIFHGITGGSQTNYIRVLTQKGQAEGYQCLVVNQRGINSDMTSHIPFTGISFHQIQKVLEVVGKRYPTSDIFLLGTSFGGNYIIRYLCQAPLNKKIKGIVAISPPIRISQVVNDMPDMFQKFFLKKYLTQTINKHQTLKYWEQNGILSFQEINKCKNMKQFHHQFTAKVEKLQSYEQVYEKLSINEGILQKFEYQTFFLTSKDDPIVSFSSIPHDQIQKNDKIKTLITERGAHLCWYEGILPKRWYPKPIFKYLNSLRNK